MRGIPKEKWGKLQLLLIVGAKLEHIITRLAQEAAASLSNETEEVPKIKPSKDHFWFRNPGLVLHLIHFILFQNSFEIGFFFWVLVPSTSHLSVS
jgi:mlo protein